MAGPRIVLRSDAGPTIGIGHVVRTLALGSALVRKGCEVTLVATELPDTLADDAVEAGVAVEWVHTHDVAAVVERLRPGLVVVDGYHLGDVVRELAQLPVAVGVIDDNAELPTADAAMIVNQNLHAFSELYPGGRVNRKMLLGPRYVLLRPAVAALAPRDVGGDNVRTVLVSIGGSDPLGLTESIVTALLGETSVDVWLAIGPANRRRADLIDLAARNADRLTIDPGDVVTGYGNADVAVIGAGTTLWEVGYLGIPSIALVVADNQVGAAAAAARRGFIEEVDARLGRVERVVPLLTELSSDPSRRRRMASAGRALFDNRGPERVATAIIEVISEAS